MIQPALRTGLITSHLISRYLVRRGFINLYPHHTTPARVQKPVSDIRLTGL
jgi:hypothetical protein